MNRMRALRRSIIVVWFVVTFLVTGVAVADDGDKGNGYTKTCIVPNQITLSTFTICT